MISADEVELRDAGGDERGFDDARGRRWIVYERPQGIGHYPVRSYLFFESVRVVRRVRTYPHDWRALDVPALERLSWAR